MPTRISPGQGAGKRSTIQSVDRAARILEALASGPRRLGVSELADRLGLTRPTVHGLLQTLQAHGFVEQDRDSDKYQLGAGLLQLGNSYLDLNELRGRSIVHAERLAARAQAAVRVGVMHGPTVVVVHHDFGLGLAALGRPGYLNLGHGDDLGEERTPAALERRAHEVLDAAYERGIRYF